MSLHASSSAAVGSAAARAAWHVSLPLLAGVLVYLYTLSQGQAVLQDGDTAWHIAVGQWIFEHGAIPAHDPFSHTMAGAPWTAHEWLSELLLAAAHGAGGWTGVAAITSLAMAATIALLTRALLRSLEPVYVVAFAMLAVVMTAAHLLARPHILAMPLMMIWVIEVIRARESGRAPSLWLLPVMTLWANMHGGFTLGLALALAFAVEAVFDGRKRRQARSTAKAWGIFLVLGTGSALLTPHGPQGIYFTWQVLFETRYALGRIGEWRSPNFQKLQPLEIWLLGAMALAMYQGLRFPLIRLVLLLGLVHISLKHVRNVELLGLLAPLFLATPLAEQWCQRQQAKPQFDKGDTLLRKLAGRAGRNAVLLGLGAAAVVTFSISRARPLSPPEEIAPVLAVRAVQQAGIKGPVLNNYGWGGYLIYVGIPPFIDGRADMYGDAFLKEYAEAIDLRTSDGLQKLLAKHKISWTLLEPGSASVALLDHLPQWRRLYSDATAVVHVKSAAEAAPSAAAGGSGSASQ